MPPRLDLSVMSKKSNPENRIVVVKTIDDLFYEPQNLKRSHTQAFRLFIHPLYGICPSSNRNYRLASDELLKSYPLPEHLKSMFRLDVELVKNMQQAEAAKVLNEFCEMVKAGIARAKKEQVPVKAETIIRYIRERN